MKKTMHKPIQKRDRLLAVLCLFAVLLLSFNGCSPRTENEPEIETLPPATYESPWTLEKSVTKHMTGTGGRTFTATILQDNRTSPPDPDRARDEEICLELCAEWMLSCIALDYTLHFSLFPEQQLAEFEKEELSPRGFSLEEAKLRIEEATKAAYGLTDFRLDLSLVDISFDTPEKSQDFEQYEKPKFEQYGMDSNAIESYAVCTFDRAKLILHDTLCYESILNDWSSIITLYRYNGVWYLEPQRLDDDLSIDLLPSKKGETQEYYEEITRTGTVTAIRNGLIFINATFVSPLTDACKGLWVGAEVTVKYYTTGIKFRDKTSEWESTRDLLVGVIIEAEKTTQADSSIIK